jgi:excisionase family DNA binding protein
MERLLYTVAEASDLLSIRKTKLYEFISSGELPSLKIGASRRIPGTALEEFVSSRCAQD